MDTIDKINYYLVKQGKTGADLSRALGLSNSVYSQWNTGKTKPKKSKLMAIAEYLGVSVEDIMPDGYDAPAVSTGAKKKRPADGETLISDLPEEVQELIQLCLKTPSLVPAFVDLARQIEKGSSARE